MNSALVLALALCAPAARPPRLIVLDVKVEAGALRPEERRALLDAIVAETGRFPQVESVSIAELRAALDLESVKQDAGCDELTCVGEIGNAFGARYVLFSSMNRVGAQWQLSVSFYDSETTTVVGRGSLRGVTVTDIADIAADVVEEALSPLGKPRPRRTPRPVVGTPVPAVGAQPAPIVLDPEAVDLTREPLDPRALASCAYVPASDVWDCGQSPRVVRASTGTLTTTAEVRVTADVARGCVASVTVELVAGAEPLVVAFNEASATVDGVARPLKADLVGGVLRVPARSRGSETLRPPGGCLGQPVPAGDDDVTTVEVPFTEGGRPARALWVRKRAFEVASPQELLAAIPEPERPGADLEDESPPWFMGTTVGTVVGLAGAGAGVATGALLLPPSSTEDQRTLALSGCGAAGACGLGLPAVVGGLIFDFTNRLGWEQRNEQVQQAALKKKMHAAWVRRLEPADPAR